MALSKYFKSNKIVRSADPFILQTGKKDAKINTAYRHGWAEDVYISEGGDRETIGKSFEIAKINIFIVLISLLLMALLTKTAWLQIIKGEYYYSMAEGNRIRIERIEPKRGVIYDVNMSALVRNRANFLLYFLPADLPESSAELDKIIKRVSELTKADPVVVAENLSKINRRSLEAFVPLFVADNIEYDSAMLLYLESDNWPGVVLTNKTTREYLSVLPDAVRVEEALTDNVGLSLSHVLGYTGKINSDELKQFGEEYQPIDYIGKMGIEYFWENELKGVSGKKQIEVDARGKEKKVIGQEKAEDGHNLVLSLDALAQIKLESIVSKQLEKLKLSKASAIVVNPNNGEIVALVSLPAYNNNSFARGISKEEYAGLLEHSDKPLFNRSVSGEYPSGSTFKPVMLAAALQEGVVSENTIVSSVGGIRIGQWFFPDWKAGGHGRTDARKAIAESVNTYFYYIGGGYEDFRGLGVEKIKYYSDMFGIGKQTGIDLAGEANGFLPTPAWKEEVRGERWYIGDTYHLSIGQGDLLVTPLQVAMFTSVFANGGKLYRPHFIKKILSSDDKTISETATEPVKKDFIDAYNINVVKQGMRQTVVSGSARRLSTATVEIAGKTGTAQWSTKKDNHAWFTGFAPYDNPEIVITILIEEGKEGSEVAVPIAGEFIEWYFNKNNSSTPKKSE